LQDETAVALERLDGLLARTRAALAERLTAEHERREAERRARCATVF